MFNRFKRPHPTQFGDNLLFFWLQVVGQKGLSLAICHPSSPECVRAISTFFLLQPQIGRQNHIFLTAYCLKYGQLDGHSKLSVDNSPGKHLISSPLSIGAFRTTLHHCHHSSLLVHRLILVFFQTFSTSKNVLGLGYSTHNIFITFTILLIILPR